MAEFDPVAEYERLMGADEALAAPPQEVQAATSAPPQRAPAVIAVPEVVVSCEAQSAFPGLACSRVAEEAEEDPKQKRARELMREKKIAREAKKAKTGEKTCD